MKSPRFTLNEARVLLALVVNAKAAGDADPCLKTAEALGGRDGVLAYRFALNGSEINLGNIVAAGEADKRRRAAHG